MRGSGTATPSSGRRVDGVEVMIQQWRRRVRDNLIYALAFTTLAAVPSITFAAAASATTFAVPSVAAAAASTSTSASSSTAAAAASSATSPPAAALLF